MADKETKLSIVIRTVDRATAGINAISARLDKLTRPVREFRKALGELREKSGLDNVIGGFAGVGNAVGGVLAKVGILGGVLAAATAGMLSLVGQFDDLGDKAVKIGVGVDFLASFRFAAERAGASVEQADQGLESFGKNIGLARAGMGRMVPFLKAVSPVLLKQALATKSNEEAVLLFANAMSKIRDPAKRAALASKVFGDTALAPLLAKGAAGVDELQKRFLKLAGSQQGAADAAGETDDALKDLKASTDGAKAALVTGLAPALTIIIGKMSTWLTAHRADIAQWASDIGTRLPAAVDKVVDTVSEAVDRVSSFVEGVGGIKTVAIGAAAILAGPLLLAVGSLTTSIVTLLARLALLPAATAAIGTAGTAAAGANAAAGAAGSGALGTIGRALPPIALAFGLAEASGGSIAGKFQAFAKGELAKGGGTASIGSMIQVMEEGFGARAAIPDVAGRLGERATAARDAVSGASTETVVKVAFENAPPGMRTTTNNTRGAATVDLSVGYQIFGLP